MQTDVDLQYPYLLNPVARLAFSEVMKLLRRVICASRESFVSLADFNSAFQNKVKVLISILADRL